MKTIDRLDNQINNIEKLYNENTRTLGFSKERALLFLKATFTFERMLNEQGVSGSSVFDTKGRKVYFDIKREGLHPFVVVNGKMRYMKSDAKVRYFKDNHYTSVDGWVSYAHTRNENDELVIKPEIKKLMNN